MSLRGHLQEINIGGIIQTLSMERNSGTMRVRIKDGAQVQERYFSLGEHGEITLIIPGRQARIGQLLVQAGKVTQDQVEQALAAAEEEKGGRRLSDILVERGHIQEGDIEDVLKKNFRDGFFELCLAQEGTFEFFFNTPPTRILGDDAVYSQVSMNTSGLIMDALRQIDEWQVIRAAIRTNQAIFVRHLNYLEGMKTLDLGEKGLEAARLIDGKRTVDDLARELETVTDFELYEIMNRMIENDMVRSLEAHEAIELALEAEYFEHFDQAIKHYYYALFLKPENKKMRVRLFEMVGKMNRYEDALRQALVLGQRALAENDIEEALTYFDKAADIEARHPEVLDGLYRCYLKIGKRDESAEYLQAAYETGELLVKEQTRVAKFDEAQTIARELLRDNPDNVTYLLFNAEISQSLGEPERAAEHYREVSAILERQAERTREQEDQLSEVYERLLSLSSDEEERERIRLQIYETSMAKVRAERRTRARNAVVLAVGGLLVITLAYLSLVEQPVRALIRRAKEMEPGAGSVILREVAKIYQDIESRSPLNLSIPVLTGEITRRREDAERLADAALRREASESSGQTIAELKLQQAELKKELTAERQKVAGLTTENAEAKTTIERFKTKFQESEERLQAETARATKLQDEITQALARIKELEPKVKDLEAREQALLTRVDELKKALALATTAPPPEVDGFAADLERLNRPIGWPPAEGEPKPDRIR